MALLPFPDLLEILERSPAIVEESEFWRLVTAFFILGDTAGQIAFNFAGLAVIGSLAEWRTGRLAWLAAYVAGGLTGQIAGLAWKPFGAGNSVAVMGLLGLLLVAMVLRKDAQWRERLLWPLAGLGVAVVLCLAMDVHGPPIFAGALVGSLVIQRRREA